MSTRVIAAMLCLMGCALLARAAEVPVNRLRDVSDEWFKSDEGRQTIANIISWQNANGGWWKSYDTSKPRPADAKSKGNNPNAPRSDADWSHTSTIDNDATYTELRLLARAVSITGDEAARAAFNKGLEFIFASQYANGGWPQRFPLEKNYGRHITFNDGAMAGVMKVLRDAAAGARGFEWLDDATRQKCRESFDRGVDCVLKCQIKVGGKLTAWCQQHDEVTFEPTNARAYELPSLCSTESAELTQILMDIPDPSPEVRNAVESAVAWFESAKILGKRYDRLTDADGRVRRVLSDDPDAPPIWARFYDIETNKPFFCDRDGVKRWSLSEVSDERQRGYAWFSTAPGNVLKNYQKWKTRADH